MTGDKPRDEARGLSEPSEAAEATEAEERPYNRHRHRHRRPRHTRRHRRCHGRHGRHRHGGARGSLQRRIFRALAASMLVTALVAGIAGAVFRPSRRGPDVDAVRRLFTDRFAERWHDPGAREALTRESAEAIRLGVEVLDPQGALLHRAGRTCHERYVMRAVVRATNGDELGSLRVCMPPHHGRWPWFVGITLMFFGALWWMSGRIARRIVRPLDSAADAALRIGEGEYSARLDLEGAPREIRGLGTAMNAMAEKVEAAANHQKMLLASVSHEIRTPLGHMRLLIDTGRDEDSLSEDVAGELEREVVAVDGLVSQLLAGSKLDTIGPERRLLDLGELVDRALRRIGADACIVPEFRDGDVSGALTVDADPTLLAQALANLLRNAEEHGQGVRAVQLGRQDGEVVVCVRDAGEGLSSEALARLSEPFVRRPTDNADSAGSLGLGLALTRRIAEAHGGRLRASRWTGGGEVQLILPAPAATTAGDN